MALRFRQLAGSCLVAVSLVGCGGEPKDPADTPAAENGTPSPHQNPLNFAVWHADFPFPLELSPEAPSPAHRFSRLQALERVAAKLQGNCTRAAWLMAKEYFSRAGPEAVPVLIEALDRALQSAQLADVVQNVAEALGRMGRLHSTDVAEALLRALQHPKESVKNSAMAALVQAGTPDTVLRARAFWDELTPRACHDWLRAARAHLPLEQLEPIYGELRDDPAQAPIFSFLIEEILQLPLPVAARLLEPMWDEARGNLRMTIASVLHLVGDLRGTHHLQERLRDAPPQQKIEAVNAIAQGDLARLGDDLLKLSVDPDPAVRQAVIVALSRHSGENIDNIIATAAMDPVTAVRQPALAALRMRGKQEYLDQLVDLVRTATGTKLLQVLADVAAAGYPEAIPVMEERMASSPPEERKKFIQAIGVSRVPEAAAALKRVFDQQEERIDHHDQQTNVTYAGTLLPNHPAQAPLLLEWFGEEERSDYRRRAYLLQALGNIAALTPDAALAKSVYDTYRNVLADADEIPQMRLLALEYLRRDLTLDDMEALQGMAQRETGPMRRALVNALFEFF